MMKKILLTLSASVAFHVAALEPLSSAEMDNVTGQGGVYLTGDLVINESGGPLNADGPSGNGYNWQAVCSSGTLDRRCGARLAINTGNGRGWFVLDNIRGRFSFEGLTLRTRTINSGFGNDGASFNGDVFEIGLPNQLDYDNASFTIANSNSARPTDSGFQQTDVVTIEVNGTANLQGNLLIFPTGTP
ncbi:hypothetical protein [Bacterioplanoides sp. SCSIO 12839]|uniref:hypothetical protein n=1 Tax=Bacterioplanoides sp. SCSIO 12839 TaxID=2829569 RepID=UPI002103257E|nr:hypothetical protein [Bacterioplanoides sp. SCSIO 12839]UTW48712.1 hypothetical protein KFF03_02060 [Bacterioplanoides sp. SCSIO 12839]